MSGNETLEAQSVNAIETLLDSVMNDTTVSVDELREFSSLLDELEDRAPEFAKGERVRVSSGGVATVVATLPMNASEYQIKGKGLTVSEYHNNDFENDRVVVCRFERNGKHYYYPESSLESAYTDEEEDEEEVDEVSTEEREIEGIIITNDINYLSSYEDLTLDKTLNI